MSRQEGGYKSVNDLVFVDSDVFLRWYVYTMQRIKKNYIMDENDSLSEYIKIPPGHNRTNGTVYSIIDFKVEICSAL